MNAIALLDVGLCVRLVHTFAHFLWQAAAVAALAFAAAGLLRKASAQGRYVVLVAGLLVMAACPVATFWLVNPPAEPAVGIEMPPVDPPPTLPADATDFPKPAADAAGMPAPALGTDRVDGDVPAACAAGLGAVGELPRHAPAPAGTSWLAAAAPYLTAAYLAGVLLMLGRLLVALHGGRRLRKLSKPVTDPGLHALIARQAKSFGFRLAPAVAWCSRVAAPTVVGILRSTVLLPVELTTGLSSTQIEAVLSHELAHIRRWDPLVNLLQRLIEAALFFHPAVWLLSRRIRIEREHCADDAVLAAGGEPLAYADALIALAEHAMKPRRQPATASAAALGAADKPSRLRGRVERLVARTADQRPRLSRAWPLAICLAALAAAGAVIYGGTRPPLGERPVPQDAGGEVAAEEAPTSRPAAEAEWSAPVDGLRARLVPTRPYFIPHQTPFVRFEIQNASDRDILIRPPQHRGGFVNVRFHVRMLGERGPGRDLGGGPKPVGWQPPAPVALRPGQTLDALCQVAPTPDGYKLGEPWEVLAAFESPSHPLAGDQKLWRGRIETSAAVRFHDLTKLPAEQVVGFLNTDGPTYYSVSWELARRWSLPGPVEQWRFAFRSGNGRYVLFFDSSAFDGVGLPSCEGRHLALVGSDGKVLWSKAIRFVDWPAVSDTGCVAVPEWLDAMGLRPRVQVHLIDADGGTLGQYGLEPDEQFLSHRQRNPHGGRETFGLVLAQGFGPRAERYYFLSQSRWAEPSMRLYCIDRAGKLQWSAAADFMGPWAICAGNAVQVSPDGRYVLVANTTVEPSKGFAVFSAAGRELLSVDKLRGLQGDGDLRRNAFRFAGDKLIVTDRDGVRQFDLSPAPSPASRPAESAAPAAPMTPDDVAAYHRGLTGEDLPVEALKKLYTDRAMQEAQSGGDPHEMEAAVRRALAFDQDERTRLQLQVYLGDAYWRQTSRYTPEVWGPQRRKAAGAYLDGLAIVLRQELPAEPPELPAVGMYNVDGPPEEVERYRAQHARELAARQEAERVRELVQFRRTLTGQITQMYARDPEDLVQLRQLAMDRLGNEQAADALVADAKARRAAAEQIEAFKAEVARLVAEVGKRLPDTWQVKGVGYATSRGDNWPSGYHALLHLERKGVRPEDYKLRADQTGSIELVVMLGEFQPPAAPEDAAQAGNAHQWDRRWRGHALFAMTFKGPDFDKAHQALLDAMAATEDAPASRPVVDAEAATLGGRVLDGKGRPVPDATVTIVESERWIPAPHATRITVRSDAGGRFRFAEPLRLLDAKTRLRRALFVSKAGFGLWGCELDGQGARTDVVVLLTKPSQVWGTVVDARGEGVAGARVRLLSYSDPAGTVVAADCGPGEPQTLADGAGAFVLGGLPAEGIANLCVECAGYALQAVYGIPLADSPWNEAVGGKLKYKPAEPVKVTLRRAAVLRGVAVFANSGQPAPGVMIAAQGIKDATWSQAETGEDGTFELSDVDPAACNVLALLDPTDRTALPEWTAAAVPIESLEPGQIRQHLKIVLTRGGIVQGRVTDAGGHPLAGVSIGLTSAARPGSGAAVGSVDTREGGTWSYRLPPGPVGIHVRWPMPPGAHWRPASRRLDLKNGETSTGLDFQLDAELPAASAAPPGTAATRPAPTTRSDAPPPTGELHGEAYSAAVHASSAADRARAAYQKAFKPGDSGPATLEPFAEVERLFREAIEKASFSDLGVYARLRLSGAYRYHGQREQAEAMTAEAEQLRQVVEKLKKQHRLRREGADWPELAAMIRLLREPGTGKPSAEQLAAAWAKLGDRQDEAVGRLMEEFWPGADYSYRWRTISALGALNSPASRRALLQMALRSDRYDLPWIRGAAREYVQVLPDKSDARLLLASEDTDVLQQAAAGLRGVALDRPMLDRLLPLMASPDHHLRRLVVAVLSQDPGGQFAAEKVAAIVGTLPDIATMDKAEEVAWPGSWTLAEVHYRERIRALAEMKNAAASLSLQLRAAAAGSQAWRCLVLARAFAGEADACADVRKVLGDADAGMFRAWAAEALGRIGGADDLPLLRETARTDPMQREQGGCLAPENKQLYFPVREAAQRAAKALEESAAGASSAPASRPAEFSPFSFERMLHDGGRHQPIFFDLDTGRAWWPPFELAAADPAKPLVLPNLAMTKPLTEWVRRHGVDFVLQVNGNRLAVMGLDVRVGEPLKADDQGIYPELTPGQVVQLATAERRGGADGIVTFTADLPTYTLPGNRTDLHLDARYPVVTSDGGVAVLDLFEITNSFRKNPTLGPDCIRARFTITSVADAARQAGLAGRSAQRITAEGGLLSDKPAGLVIDIAEGRLRLRSADDEQIIAVGPKILRVWSGGEPVAEAARLDTGVLDVDAPRGTVGLRGRGGEAVVTLKDGSIHVTRTGQPPRQGHLLSIQMPELDIVVDRGADTTDEPPPGPPASQPDDAAAPSGARLDAEVFRLDLPAEEVEKLKKSLAAGPGGSPRFKLDAKQQGLIAEIGSVRIAAPFEEGTRLAKDVMAPVRLPGDLTPKLIAHGRLEVLLGVVKLDDSDPPAGTMSIQVSVDDWQQRIPRAARLPAKTVSGFKIRYEGRVQVGRAIPLWTPRLPDGSTCLVWIAVRPGMAATDALPASRPATGPAGEAPAGELAVPQPTMKLSVRGPVVAGLPVWVYVQTDDKLAAANLRYPFTAVPWQLKRYGFEVRRDGRLLPMRPIQRDVGMLGIGGFGSVAPPGAPGGRLPLHLLYALDQPGKCEVRLVLYSDSGTAPAGGAEGRRAVSDWLELNVGASTPDEQRQWLAATVSKPPTDVGQIVGDYLPSLLVSTDERVGGVLMDMLYHDDALVQKYALAGLAGYFGDDLLRREIPRLIRKSGPTVLLAHFLSWRKDLFAAEADKLAEACMAALQPDVPGAAAGGLQALCFLKLHYAWDKWPDVAAKMDRAVLSAAERLAATPNDAARLALSRYLGTVKSAASRRLLWRLAGEPAAREQALIALCWLADAEDLPKLAEAMIRGGPGAASLPYHLHRAYGQGALKYISLAIELSQDPAVVQACGETLEKAKAAAPPASRPASEPAAEAEFDPALRDPRHFVRMSDHDITPAVARKLLTPDALPTLYKLLEDPEHRQYWSNVARTICCLSDDPKAASAVIGYIRRSDHWKQGASETHYECAGKLQAIQWLGLLGGEEAEGVLIKAMTPDGARELIKAWIDGPLPVWATRPDEGIIGHIQGSAAIGIVLSQNRQGAKQVEALYEASRRHCQHLGHYTAQLQKTARAMALCELIGSVGRQAYLDSLETMEYYSFVEQRYAEYMNFVKPPAPADQAGRTVASEPDDAEDVPWSQTVNGLQVRLLVVRGQLTETTRLVDGTVKPVKVPMDHPVLELRNVSERWMFVPFVWGELPVAEFSIGGYPELKSPPDYSELFEVPQSLDPGRTLRRQLSGNLFGNYLIAYGRRAAEHGWDVFDPADKEYEIRATVAWDREEMRFTPSESETVRVWTGRLTTNPVTVRLASRWEGKHWPPSQPQSPASRPAIDPAILERDAAQDQATRSAASAAYDKATDALLAGAPRAEAAKQFAAISDTYPQSRWAPLSAELGRLLAEMAEADRQFREPPDPDALPMKERIEYLVFKLRDVAVRELFGPGKCQVLFLKRDHAAWRLRRIGKPAVPALLALLDDRRPTRSSCEPLNGGHVLRYADVALQVLEAIAARTFDHQTLRGSCLTNADEQTREEIVEEVELWWRRNRDKDEAEWIRESLAAGGVTSMWNRLQWAERLIDLQGPAAADFFRRRLAAEPDNPHIPRLLNEAMAAAAGEPSSRPAALDLQDAARRLTEATGFEWRVARRERAPGLGAELSGGVSTWHGLIVPYFVLPFAPDEGKLALFRQNCNAALEVIAHDQRCTLLAGPAREPAVTAKVLSALGLQQTEEAERLRLAHARAEWMDFRLAVAQPAEGQAGLRTLADGPSDDQIQDYRQLLVAKGPNGGRHRGDPFLWFHPMGFCGLPATLVTAEDRTQVPYILLSDRPQDTMLGRSSRPRPWHLKRVYAASDARGGPAVAIEFDEAAARRMGELTAANIGRPLAVLFSGNVLCVLPIQAKIAGRMLLTGDKLDKPLVDRIVQTLSECMLVEDAAPEKAQGSAPGP